MKLNLPITITLILGIMLPGCKQSDMQSSPEETLIREARIKSNEAIAAHDAKAMSAFWTSDFHIITSRNSEMSGKNTNRERMESEFSSKSDVLYVRTPQTIQVFDARLTRGHLRQHISLQSGLGPAEAGEEIHGALEELPSCAMRAYYLT
jgi:hypothetical protein